MLYNVASGGYMKHIKKGLILLLIVCCLPLFSSCVSLEKELYYYSLFTVDKGISLISEDIAVRTVNSNDNKREISYTYNFHTEYDMDATFYLPYFYEGGNSNQISLISHNGLSYQGILIGDRIHFDGRPPFMFDEDYDFYKSMFNLESKFGIWGYCYTVNDSFIDDYNFIENDTNYIYLNKNEGNRKIFTAGIMHDDSSEEIPDNACLLIPSLDEYSLFVIGEDIDNMEYNGLSDFYDKTEMTLGEYITILNYNNYSINPSDFPNNFIEEFDEVTSLDSWNEIDDYDLYDIWDFEDPIYGDLSQYNHSNYCVLVYEVTLSGGQVDNIFTLTYPIELGYSYNYHDKVREFNIYTSPKDDYLDKGNSKISVEVPDLPYLIDNNINLTLDGESYIGNNNQELITFFFSTESDPMTKTDYDNSFLAKWYSDFLIPTILGFLILIPILIGLPIDLLYKHRRKKKLKKLFSDIDKKE